MYVHKYKVYGIVDEFHVQKIWNFYDFDGIQCNLCAYEWSVINLLNYQNTFGCRCNYNAETDNIMITLCTHVARTDDGASTCVPYMSFERCIDLHPTSRTGSSTTRAVLQPQHRHRALREGMKKKNRARAQCMQGGSTPIKMCTTLRMRIHDARGRPKCSFYDHLMCAHCRFCAVIIALGLVMFRFFFYIAAVPLDVHKVCTRLAVLTTVFAVGAARVSHSLPVWEWYECVLSPLRVLRVVRSVQQQRWCTIPKLIMCGSCDGRRCLWNGIAPCTARK